MKISISLCTLALFGSLAGCGTMMTAPARNFLSDQVDSVPGERPDPIVRHATVAIDPERTQLGEVVWLADPTTDLTGEEQRQLIELLATQLRSSLQNLTPAPGGRPVIVRAAITRVEPVSPALNAVSTLLLVAPWDRGGAAMEIEAVDADTGKQLAAIREGYFAPLSDFKARFSKLSAAEISIRKTVTEFSALLTPAEAGGQAGRP